MLGAALREVCLLLAAFGFIRIFVVFLFQGLFARMALPRILGDVLFAISLRHLYRLPHVRGRLRLCQHCHHLHGYRRRRGAFAERAPGEPLGRRRDSTRQHLPHRRLGAYRGSDGAGGQHSLAVHGARHQRGRDADHSQFGAGQPIASMCSRGVATSAFRGGVRSSSGWDTNGPRAG